MAVRRRNGTYDVSCDECGGDCDYAEPSFREAVARFKDDGGKVYLNDEDEWRHACADCRTR